MIIDNPFRGTGLPALGARPSVDADAPGQLLKRCPDFAVTQLVNATALAADMGIAELWLKDERTRMGLGSFKALGAAYVIARNANQGRAKGQTYVAASAGNHGLSVAVGARIFGAKAVILLAETVPESFAERLRGEGADVVRAGAVYEESMAEAMRLADVNGWTLLSDSSWTGYTEIPTRVMEGYLQMAAEAAAQMQAPTHIFLQAGVGGLAAAVAAYARKVWGDAPVITVVEPEFAPACLEAIRAGKIVTAGGPVSEMGRLDCKEASMVAMAGLSYDADQFMTVTEIEAANAVAQLSPEFKTTASGGAGVAGALIADLPADAKVLCIVSEAA